MNDFKFFTQVRLKMDTDVLEKRAASFFKATELSLGRRLNPSQCQNPKSQLSIWTIPIVKACKT
jgi:hypothetical protein